MKLWKRYNSLYNVWSQMKKRCLNPNHPKYRHYGGRGITVCNEWKESFDRFVLDMGPRPPGRSLDRIDNDGNYSKENCRWATKGQSNRNRRMGLLVPVTTTTRERLEE
jgi:hypothetical protein